MKIVNGSFDISYQGQMVSAGHSSDECFRDGYDGTVEVNFVAFLSEDKDIYIVQVDTLFIDDVLKTEIQNELIRDSIPVTLLCVTSHSHSLPGVDPTKLTLGGYYKKYRKFLKNKISDNISESIKSEDLEQVYFSSYKVHSQLSIGRRGAKSKNNFSLFGIRNTVPDFSQLGADIEITCFWDKSKRKILSIIWTFPAHPVLYPGNKKFSADFPGRVRDLLREELKDESLVVLYFPGCSGDMRPLIKAQTKQKKVLDFIVGQSFMDCDINQYEKYCNSLKTELCRCIKFSQKEERIEILALVDCQESKIKLEKIGISNINNNHLRIEFLQFNKKTRFAFLNCEPSYAYHDFFGKECTVTGYSSGVFGYLPTDIQVNQGGYEVSGFMKFFETSGSFIKNIEKTIKDECTVN